MGNKPEFSLWDVYKHLENGGDQAVVMPSLRYYGELSKLDKSVGVSTSGMPEGYESSDFKGASSNTGDPELDAKLERKEAEEAEKKLAELELSKSEEVVRAEESADGIVVPLEGKGIELEL